MDALDALGLFAAVIPFIIGVSLFWFLGGMPGRVAEKTGHPDLEAIRIGGWASLVLGVVGWPWVLMWAYRKPQCASGDSDELTRLEARVAELELRLATTQSDSEEGAVK